ncbi:MAG TPA: AraC family transcriptional regulator ligand-binding domain-containing protein [Spongiibacteraceae bacterium]|nr:AraC family transcriptional regulator ligand-binding domain-containing protein [Spongiibacteraceae bacterium]HUH37083.1 AraC family transcriptional regulator ligand-binding domain-containing protein [Spongiibacteraceae bacterium]
MQPMIPLSQAMPVLVELERRGYSREQVFAETGIPRVQAASGAGDLLLSAGDFSRLYNHACRLLEAVTSGRRDNSHISKDAQDMMCYCIITCPTLGAAIERAAVYCRVASPIGEVFKLQKTERDAALVIELCRQQRDSASLIVSLSAMNMLHQLFSWMTGRLLRLKEVSLSYPRPQALLVPGTLATQPLRWQAECDAMIFPAQYLDLPIVRSAAELDQVIDYLPFDVQHCTGQLQTLSGRLRALLMSALQQGLAPMSSETAAQVVHMSPATLRRNLQKEGTNFTAILKECQRSHALHLVRSTDIPISDIAARTGYSDDRAFRRAFQGWTGLSPSTYRSEPGAGNTVSAGD